VHARERVDECNNLVCNFGGSQMTRLSMSALTLLIITLSAWPASGANHGGFYSGSGGTAVMAFDGSKVRCPLTVVVTINSLTATIATNDRLSRGELSAVLDEASTGCRTSPLGQKSEQYELKVGAFNGTTLTMAFIGSSISRTKNTAVYSGMLGDDGKLFSGSITFKRYDRTTGELNSTIVVDQAIAQQGPAVTRDSAQ
jgi:hypothetical protein